MSEVPARLAAALTDRYTIEREIGAGGMATVYLAHDIKHDRKVALKVLKPDLAAVLGADRFVVEIRTTASLQHPHILPLFDSGTADGFLYYVMPFIDGETLRAKLDRDTQLGIEESVRIATDVASALHYAHTHGVIHRDIKPENILLHDGRPVVADFGIALAVSAAAGGRMTETGLSLGTPHYMSPEQATADKDIGARSDIYSLASVLYEMLTGEPPHMGNSAQQIIMKIIADTPRPVAELRKSVPLFTWDREINSIGWALDGALLIEANGPEGPDIFTLRPGNDSVPRLLFSEPGRQLLPAVSPDGRWLAYASAETGRSEIYVRPYPDVNASRTPVTSQGGSRPGWSSSGRELFYVLRALDQSDAVGEMHSVTIPVGNSFTVGEDRLLFRQPRGIDYWGVTPDAQRFAVVRGQRSATGSDYSLVIVENWFAELKAKLRR